MEKNNKEFIEELRKELNKFGDIILDIKEDNIISFLRINNKGDNIFKNKEILEILNILDKYLEIYNIEIKVDYFSSLVFYIYLDSFYN